ncbi:MAG: hypothetical protein JNL23_02050 [Chitinophagaceae bacterium]|nr:hypothetical protein [Chitinophagaceae bacterium]
MILKLIVFVALLITSKITFTQNLNVHDIDVIVSQIQNSSNVYAIDSGKIKLINSKDSAFYYDIYHFDSTTHELLSVDHQQDTSVYRDLISFYYHKNKVIKVLYGLYILDENGQGLLQSYEHYYNRNKTIHTEQPYNHNFKYFKFLTAKELYQMGNIYLTKYYFKSK